MKTIAVVVPTRNEEVHIRRCLDSITFSKHIFILDSDSTDSTCKIAAEMGCSILSYPRDVVFSHKLNDAFIKLQNYDLVFRVDADETISSKLSMQILDLLCSPTPLRPAYSVARKLCFSTAIMRWGGTSSYPFRLVNPKLVNYQATVIDEHIDLQGFLSGSLSGEIYDNPLHGYSHWLRKHILYSEQEASSFYSPDLFKQKSFVIRLYYKFPAFLRPILLFLYRYIFLLGFLDGWPGLYYHLSQTIVYRLIVDVRISSRL